MHLINTMKNYFSVSDTILLVAGRIIVTQKIIIVTQKIIIVTQKIEHRQHELL